MPTTTAEVTDLAEAMSEVQAEARPRVKTHNCCRCNTRKPIHQFSVATSICLECFDRMYGICEECGMIVYHHGRGTTRSTHQRAHYHLGQVLCSRCTGGRSNDRCWRPTALNVSVASYERIGSKRKFGIEIETATCDSYPELFGHTHWGAKSDCTIGGKEFDSPILYGDEGFEQVEEILAFGSDHDWTADEYCGCHTHYDMRDESKDQLLSIMYAHSKCVAMWARFVPGHRASGSYSNLPGWGPSDLRDAVGRHPRAENLSDAVRGLGLDRYEMINFAAYWDHNTFEVRMLEGTVDPDTICKWVTIQCRFMDAVKDMSFDELDEIFNDCHEDNLATLADLIGDAELIDWLESRDAEFGNRPARVRS